MVRLPAAAAKALDRPCLAVASPDDHALEGRKRRPPFDGLQSRWPTTCHGAVAALGRPLKRQNLRSNPRSSLGTRVRAQFVLDRAVDGYTLPAWQISTLPTLYSTLAETSPDDQIESADWFRVRLRHTRSAPSLRVEPLQRLTAADLAAVVISYRDVLRMHQWDINRLNVYPVPDDDTGTNMTLTMESAVSELEQLQRYDLDGVTRAISEGSLIWGPRQLGDHLVANPPGHGRGLSGRTRRGRQHDDRGFRPSHLGRLCSGHAPRRGNDPVCAKATSTTATSTNGPLSKVLLAARAAAGTALRHTPNQLPILKAAGVVDAGGAGFVLLLDSLLHIATAQPLPTPPGTVLGWAVADAGPRKDPARPTHVRLSEPPYEVMCLLEASDQAIIALRTAWADIGTSVTIVGGDGLWNCHIHTLSARAAIQAASRVGRPSQVRVTELTTTESAVCDNNPPPPFAHT